MDQLDFMVVAVVEETGIQDIAMLVLAVVVLVLLVKIVHLDLITLEKVGLVEEEMERMHRVLLVPGLMDVVVEVVVILLFREPVEMVL